MKDVKKCMIINGVADCLWFMKIGACSGRETSREETIHHFVTFPAFSANFMVTFHEIASDKLRCRKLCSSWVPKMFIEEHKMKWQASALTFLTQYSEQGNDFLSRTVTGNETRMLHVTPESKQQSMERRHTSPPIMNKFKQTIPTSKILCTLFWDKKRVLLVEFLPQGSTIDAGIYCDTLKKLHYAIQNKQHGMLTRGVVMLHDNARPHTATTT
jgi:hypothetical protein